jgi:hypothetical protein
MAGTGEPEFMVQSNDTIQKGRRTMKHRALFLAFLVGTVVLFATMASAQDTSPYLAGTWMETSGVTPTVHTQHFIINPTTKQLDVYAVVFGYEGAGALLGCTVCTVNGNGVLTFYGDAARSNNDNGTVKFFAFPAGTRKFDPNAVIGGFQQNIFEDDGTRTGMTEANLKAVTINSSTIGEFALIPVLCKSCIPD